MHGTERSKEAQHNTPSSHLGRTNFINQIIISILKAVTHKHSTAPLSKHRNTPWGELEINDVGK